ncbi:putative transmembrane protein 1h [SARS coronavirus ZJ0301]|uniref:Putative transmembrane protein 1h n=2 Tax=Severe acute respiratory syndrome coronavirus TaxID=694009 RepID=Q3S2D7_SARS|nr:putative transmembrane protein 1h [SARS coronavirus ZJ01]ABA02255.1 putative transmembrane protein 1h [SARS coronavirus ZJ0301]
MDCGWMTQYTVQDMSFAQQKTCLILTMKICSFANPTIAFLFRLAMFNFVLLAILCKIVCLGLKLILLTLRHPSINLSVSNLVKHFQF